MSLDFILLLLLELCHVEAFVNDFGDGADLRAELVLDPVQGESVVVRDEVEGGGVAQAMMHQPPPPSSVVVSFPSPIFPMYLVIQ